MCVTEECVTLAEAIGAQHARRFLAFRTRPDRIVVSGQKPHDLPPAGSLPMRDDFEAEASGRAVIVFVREHASLGRQACRQASVHAALVRVRPEESVAHGRDVPRVTYLERAEVTTTLQPDHSKEVIELAQCGVCLDIDIQPERGARHIDSKLYDGGDALSIGTRTFRPMTKHLALRIGRTAQIAFALGFVSRSHAGTSGTSSRSLLKTRLHDE